MRAMSRREIETVHEFPAAGRAVGARLAECEERLTAVERQLDALSETTGENSSQAEKVAAVLSFAVNKHSGTGKVALSPHDVKGCTGVSRRYAYDLIDTIGERVEGAHVREATQVRTGSGTKRKHKALLVDCEALHTDDGAVKEFITDAGVEENS
jgi:uncharacterized coiled-coil protein SlyX